MTGTLPDWLQVIFGLIALAIPIFGTRQRRVKRRKRRTRLKFGPIEVVSSEDTEDQS